jgi:hypothetical protein
MLFLKDVAIDAVLTVPEECFYQIEVFVSLLSRSAQQIGERSQMIGIFAGWCDTSI